MKQDKKEKFQVGDTVKVNRSFLATVTRITPWSVWVKPEENMAVSHCQIVPTIERKPTLRQIIGSWWYDLSRVEKTSVILSAINATFFVMNIAIIVFWLTMSITR